MSVKLSYKKMDLEVPNYFEKNNRFIWGKKILKVIIDSNLFNVKFVEFPKYSNRSLVPRVWHIIPFRLNGILCFIDEWDYGYPTTLLNQEFFNYYAELKDVKHIFKIQYTDYHKKEYERIYKEFGIKVHNFFIFPNSIIPLEKFQWQNIKHKYVAFYSGRIWRNRRFWRRHMLRNKKDFLCVDDPTSSKFSIKSKRSSAIDENLYFDLLKQTKWGLILKGKGEAGKNRREMEYTSYGMPLALNYKPIYPFEFEPNKHYFYLEKIEDLNKLKEINPMPFAKQSIDMYKKYFCFESIPNNFLKFLSRM